MLYPIQVVGFRAYFLSVSVRSGALFICLKPLEESFSLNREHPPVV